MNERVAREGGKLAIARCSMRRQSIARFLPFSFLIADTFSVNEPRQLTLCCVSTGPKAAKSHHYNKDESLRSWTLAAFLELRREKCPAVRPAPTPPPPQIPRFLGHIDVKRRQEMLYSRKSSLLTEWFLCSKAARVLESLAAKPWQYVQQGFPPKLYPDNSRY